MRKILLIVLAILSIYYVSSKNSSVKIPDSAIRFRILANSNSPKDQKIKEEVSSKLQKQLYTLLKGTKSIESAREKLNNSMKSIENTLAKEMKDKEYSYKIDYGMHYFPEKVYKGVTYDAGNYESLLVTLGKGEGDNWWCVLFPPLCVLEAEETSATNVQYKSFIKEILSRYFE